MSKLADFWFQFYFVGKNYLTSISFDQPAIPAAATAPQSSVQTSN